MSTQAPIAIIRPKSKSASFKGEPTLLVSTTSNYSWIYSDKGSGASMDVTIWRPSPSTIGYFVVGDYAQGNYNDPTGSSLIVTAVNDDPNNPLLKAPVGYSQIWNDHGSGGTYDGSIWRPVAPDGYLALGDVASSGYNSPNIPNYMCIRKDLVEDGTVGPLIWNDQSSGASMDVSLYQLIGVGGAFVAQGNYNPYSGPCYKIAGK